MECKTIFLNNFEVISVFTFTLYILLCHCGYEHAFDPIYAFIGSKLLSINTQNRTFFCSFVYIPNGNVNEPGKIVLYRCVNMQVVSSPRAQGSVAFGDVRIKIPYS